MTTGDYLDLFDASELSRERFSDLKDNSFWNNSSEKELKLHRIHAYPAKFPAFITSKAFDYAAAHNIKVKTVADVFCGCGTVAFEARRNSIDFWGCDINPVATLIATAKSNSYTLKKLEDYYEKIMIAFPRASKKVDLTKSAIERLNYWYHPEQLHDLAKLLNAINGTVSTRSHYRAFFLCAFSNILKSASRWLTKSIKPQIDPVKQPANVLAAFSVQFSSMVRAWEQTDLSSTSTTKIVNANVLEISAPPKAIDMIVTSPPYVTSYEYADLHQLSSLWLGYASDYRDLRTGSIGSTQHSLDFNREVKRLNRVGSEIVFSLFDRDRAIAKSTAKYFLDMQQVTKRCYKFLKPKGLALFVIGNTEYKSIRIDNAAHLSESLLGSGFSKVRVAKRRITNKILTPYRTEQGRFTRSDTGRHVYGEEFILIASK
ncbi:MAG: methylase family protein [Verrucomicrobiaceae bacterium]|nr:methylase family protein [Verrucomicrobiaceae bacterium]